MVRARNKETGILLLPSVLAGFLLAPLAPAVRRLLGERAAFALALLPAALFALLLGQHAAVTGGAVLRERLRWVPGLGVELAFALDGLALLFALLVTGVGVLVFIYAGAYLKGDARQARLLALLLLFMASMLGLVLADDLVLLFVFWELTSLTSYLLVGYDHERPAARAAALQALLVTGGGGLALLAGLLLLGSAAGSFSISGILEQGAVLRAHPVYLPALALVLLGAFTKSAQVPFHFWLPGAMAAPSPVSAYLHSATMVKAGVYLLARLSPALGGGDAWHYSVTLAGAATMVTGAALALGQSDLKRILAYTTVSALGAITLLLGLDTVLAIKAAVVFLLVHALYKAALFLVAGSLDHEAGTRELAALGGVARLMPLTATAAVLAALSMAGLPPLFGFVAKELLYEAKTQTPRAAALVTSAGLAANVLMVAAAGLVGWRPFFGRRGATPRPPHEGAPALWAGPLLLAALGLVFGIMPERTVGPLVESAVAAARAEHTTLTLKLWHGFNPILVLSVVTVLSGVAVYRWRQALVSVTAPLRGLVALGPSRLYEWGLEGFVGACRAATGLLQTGRLSHYLRAVIVTCVSLVALAFLLRGGLATTSPAWTQPHEAALVALIVAGALGVARATTRLVAVLSLGLVGFGVALVFLVWSGPDLALTQFAIETLSVLLFVFVIWRLPRFVAPASRLARLGDAIVAAAAGVAVTALVLSVAAQPKLAPLAEYFAAASVPEGRGRNVVNVILVDFRAFDTLGEITVLAAAALGVLALLKLRPAREPGP